MSVSRSDLSVAVRPVATRARVGLTCAALVACTLGVAVPASLAAEGGLLLAQGEAESMDDLFGADEPEESAAPAQQSAPPPAQQKEEAPVAGDAEPGSVDELFGEESAPAPAAVPVTEPKPEPGQQPAAAPQPAPPPQQVAQRAPAESSAVRLTGFYDNKLAYTYEDPDHWSRFTNTLELSLDGRNGPVDWKVSGRAVYDPVYEWENYYPHEVEDDQESEFTVRETYLDVSAGDWDLRLGRQHIIWGEMVGLFFADVVSAKDLREFILQDFDLLRIPQWAARVEYFKDDLHTELVWIPYMTYNDVGKFGSEFFPPLVPSSVPAGQVFVEQDQPQDIDDGAYGARVTYLVDGWDLAAFYYNSRDAMPSFERTITLNPAPFFSFREVHERIGQTGATLAKDLGPFVLKAEAIYNTNRPFYVLSPTDADGLLEQDFLDYVVGAEWSFPEEGRFNVQFFQRWFPDHDTAIIPDEVESGVTLLLSRRFADKWEPELLWIGSVNREDWLLRAKLTWFASGNWSVTGGVDVFNGPAYGLFGEYDDRDRVYTEIRFTF